MRVAVAMSGGVDSSVVAALLKTDGADVVGFTMLLWRESYAEAPEPDYVESARAVCAHLSIPHYVVDARDAFEREVVRYFVGEYLRGRTPNPCVRCNRQLKFGWLLNVARERGCNALATGHYARIERTDGRYQLLRGRDGRKDQSYFLYRLGQQDLSRTLLPLGTWTKERVRAYAQEQHLPAAQRGESQDICFLADGDYRRFLRERVPEAVRPGPIIHVDGRHLGEHQGLPFYTVGQRKGLGISAPHPLYVTRLDAERNGVIVGHQEDLGRRELLAGDMSYVSGEPPAAGAEFACQIRYRARPAQGRIWPLTGDRARIEFEWPLRDITPGQSVVCYDGDILIGGGVIDAERSHIIDS